MYTGIPKHTRNKHIRWSFCAKLLWTSLLLHLCIGTVSRTSRSSLSWFFFILALLEIQPFTLFIKQFMLNILDPENRYLGILERGRETAPVPNRAEILTVNFQVQYLLQFYQQNLKIMTKPFTGFQWIDWLWYWGSMGRVEAGYCTWKFAVRILALFGTGAFYGKYQAEVRHLSHA